MHIEVATYFILLKKKGLVSVFVKFFLLKMVLLTST